MSTLLDKQHRFPLDILNRISDSTLHPNDNNSAAEVLFNELYTLALSVPLQRLSHPELSANNISVYCLRLDLIDPLITGNKYFKQAAYLQLALQDRTKPLLSFGGPYSNHIHALAAAGARHGIETIGIIRGLHKGPLSPTLEDAKRYGMTIKFVSRNDYSQKQNLEYLQRLQQEFGPVHMVPEGGGEALGAWGAQAFALAGLSAMSKLGKLPSELLLASGTGSSTAGVYAALRKLDLLQQASSSHVSANKVLLPSVNSAAVIKFKESSCEPDLFRQSIEDLSDQLMESVCWSDILDNSVSTVKLTLNDKADFGGYGKCPADLQQDILNFEQQNDILLDPIYTAKALFSFIDRVKNKEVMPGSNILFFHTGGLQGRRGYNF